MKHRITLALASLAIAACADTEISAPESAASFASVAASTSDRNAAGAVYTLTNQTSGNAVAIFDRARDGTLTYASAVPTGGLGTGGGLGSQGAVVLSEDNRILLAVNAGSNDISVFAVIPPGVSVRLPDDDDDDDDGDDGDDDVRTGLSLVQTISSGGVRPVSIAIHKELVYVLNAGGSGNIAGFRLTRTGRLAPVAGSSHPLSAPDAGAAQVSFTPDGSALIVTERFTNVIDVYTVNTDGSASQPRVHASSGVTPFGFDFGRGGALIVSEAFGGALDASAASSYRVGRDGGLSLVTGSLGTTETSACWLIVSKNGRFAYTTNTSSGSITGFAIGRDGALTLLNADGVTASTGANTRPTDLALSGNGRFLYALTPGTNSVTGFLQRPDGRLEPVTVGSGLPAGAVGLAAH
jgi:6-phosphogluconolactonase